MTERIAVEERVSWLEGAFEQIPARLDSIENGLRAEIKASENVLRAEMKALENGLRAEIKASENVLRAEMKALENGLRAEIKSAELRITLWLGGIILGASGLTIAAIKLLP